MTTQDLAGLEQICGDLGATRWRDLGCARWNHPSQRFYLLSARCARAAHGRRRAQLTCDSVPNGPAGYSIALLLQIRNGEITGQRINEQGSRLSLKGKVEADGSAKIAVEGTSGDAKYNIGNAPRGSNVSFIMAVQFADRDARGKRMGDRPCTIVMKR